MQVPRLHKFSRTESKNSIEPEAATALRSQRERFCKYLGHKLPYCNEMTSGAIVFGTRFVLFSEKLKKFQKTQNVKIGGLREGLLYALMLGMGKEKPKIKESQLAGFKYFKIVDKMLRRLHDAGCQRDIAGNRILHMDQYVSLILLYMFNPICDSLRSIQRVSELKKVQKKFGAARASLGSLSEASTVFDSELLKNIIQELSLELPNVSSIPGFSNSKDTLTAVDGSVIEATGKMAWALWQTDHNAIKVHCQYEILKGVPVSMEVTDANANEKTVLASILQSNRIYVLDRGYAKYALLEEIMNVKSSFVCRIRDNAVYKINEEKTLSDKAVKAG